MAPVHAALGRGGLLRQFWVVTVAFGVSQALAATTIALCYAAAGSLGSTSAGVVFASYTVCACVLVASLVQRCGPRRVLIAGVWLVAVFVSSYTAVGRVGAVRSRVVVLGGSLCGGLGLGFMWTAQGAYMTRLVRLYADKTGQSPEVTSSWALGTFAAVVLGLEVLAKAGASLFDAQLGTDFVFVALASLAGLSAVVMSLAADDVSIVSREFGGVRGGLSEQGAEQGAAQIGDLKVGALDEDDKSESSGADPIGSSRRSNSYCFNSFGAALELLWRDRRILYLFPFNVCFGFVIAFMNYYVSGVLAVSAFGMARLGVVTAIKPATASLCSLLNSKLGSPVAKTILLGVASISYVALASVCLGLADAGLRDSQAAVVTLYVIAGSGRAAFEGANKSVLADLFHEDAAAAFANTVFQSGLAATIGFFVFPTMSARDMKLLVLCTAVASVFGIVAAYRASTATGRHNKPGYAYASIQENDGTGSGDGASLSSTVKRRERIDSLGAGGWVIV